MGDKTENKAKLWGGGDLYTWITKQETESNRKKQEVEGAEYEVTRVFLLDMTRHDFTTVCRYDLTRANGAYDIQH